MISTEFEHGDLVLGILEVVWEWQKWLLASGMGQKLVRNGFASVMGCNTRVLNVEILAKFMLVSLDAQT